jgi:hypothetical protein
LVVGLLDLVNHLPVRVIEREVSGHSLSLRSIDSAGASAEVKDGVIQIQGNLKVSDGLAEELVRQIELGHG